MNWALPGPKYFVSPGNTLQTVTCSFCGSSFSRQGSMTPGPLSANPRCLAYHARVCSALADLKNTPPIPTIRPRCSVLAGGLDFSGWGAGASCPPLEQTEMSNSDPSAIVLEGILRIGRF